MVAVKIASSRHDSTEIPDGTGNQSTMSADPTTASQRLNVDMRAQYTVRIRSVEEECGMRFDLSTTRARTRFLSAQYAAP